MSEADAIILELRKENASLRAENALLRQKVDLLVKRIFGGSSEVLSPDQLELLLGGNEAGLPLGKGDASWKRRLKPGTKSKRRPAAIPVSVGQVICR